MKIISYNGRFSRFTELPVEIQIKIFELAGSLEQDNLVLTEENKHDETFLAKVWDRFYWEPHTSIRLYELWLYVSGRHRPTRFSLMRTSFLARQVAIEQALQEIEKMRIKGMSPSLHGERAELVGFPAWKQYIQENLKWQLKNWARREGIEG